MSTDLILLVAGFVIGPISLLMGYGVIKQKIKPGAASEQVAVLLKLQKLCGFCMLATGLINGLEVFGVI